MVEIGDQPILWHIMKLYGTRGFERFVLCLGYKGWVIKEYFLRYHEMRRDFTVSMKGDPPEVASTTRSARRTGASPAPRPAPTPAPAARLKLVRAATSTPTTFCFTYGDAVGTVDLDALLAFHRAPRPDRHGHRRPPDLALRRDEGRRRPGGRVQREADGRRGRRLRRLLRLQPRGLRLPGRRPEDLPRARAAAEAGARRPALRSSSTRASGTRWTPTATGCTSNELWKAGSAPWKVWE